MARISLCALLFLACLFSGCANSASRKSLATAGLAEISQARASESVASLLQQARSAEQRDQVEQAAQTYAQVLRLDPTNVAAHHQLAVIADQLGRYDDSEAHFLAALDKAPQDASILTSLGWSYLLQERDDEAERVLRRALELEPRHATALVNLGWLKGRRGDDEAALDLFRQVGTEAEARKLLAEVRSQRETKSAVAAGQESDSDRLIAPTPKRDRDLDLPLDLDDSYAPRGVAALKPSAGEIRNPRAVIDAIAASETETILALEDDEEEATSEIETTALKADDEEFAVDHALHEEPRSEVSAADVEAPGRRTRSPAGSRIQPMGHQVEVQTTAPSQSDTQEAARLGLNAGFPSVFQTPAAGGAPGRARSLSSRK